MVLEKRRGVTGAALLYFCFQVVEGKLGRLLGSGGPTARSIAGDGRAAYLVGGIVTVTSAFFSEWIKSWPNFKRQAVRSD